MGLGSGATHTAPHRGSGATPWLRERQGTLPQGTLLWVACMCIATTGTDIYCNPLQPDLFLGGRYGARTHVTKLVVTGSLTEICPRYTPSFLFN